MMDCIIAALVLIVFMFFMFRWFFWNVTDFMLNKKERKRRKNGQGFKEWLMYSRYRDAIPKLWLFLYFIFMIVHLINLVIALVSGAFHIPSKHTVELCTKIIAWSDVAIFAIFEILFRGSKNKITYVNVGRWIKKGKKK